MRISGMFVAWLAALTGISAFSVGLGVLALAGIRWGIVSLLN